MPSTFVWWIDLKKGQLSFYHSSEICIEKSRSRETFIAFLPLSPADLQLWLFCRFRHIRILALGFHMELGTLFG
jgi:hypothetical protein